MGNPNKVFFGAHDKIVWSISKLDHAHRKVRTEAGKIPKKFVEIA